MRLIFMNKKTFSQDLYFKNYIKIIKDLDKKIDQFYNLCKKIKKNNKILLFGNGAGAAIASHVHQILPIVQKSELCLSIILHTSHVLLMIMDLIIG